MKVPGQTLPDPPVRSEIDAQIKREADVSDSGVYAYSVITTITGTDTQTFDLGVAVFDSYAIGLSIETTDARTAGTIVATLKVDTVNTLQATIDGTNTTKHSGLATDLAYYAPAGGVLQLEIAATSFSPSTTVIVQMHFQATAVQPALALASSAHRLRASFVAGETAIGADSPVIWDTIDELVGSAVTLDLTNGQFTLNDPGTYLILGVVNIYRTDTGLLRKVTLYDVSNAADVLSAYATSGSSGSGGIITGPVTAVIRVEQSTTYDIRKTGAHTTGDRVREFTNLHIIKLD